MALPANITAESDSNVLTIAASNNKGLLIRFLNEQVEDGFYALVIDYLKDSNFDLKNMMVDSLILILRQPDVMRLKSGLNHYSSLYMAISIRWMWMLQSAHPVFIVTASG